MEKEPLTASLPPPKKSLHVAVPEECSFWHTCYCCLLATEPSQETAAAKEGGFIPAFVNPNSGCIFP